jgi:hypothetical protein
MRLVSRQIRVLVVAAAGLSGENKPEQARRAGHFSGLFAPSRFQRAKTARF